MNMLHILLKLILFYFLFRFLLKAIFFFMRFFWRPSNQHGKDYQENARKRYKNVVDAEFEETE